MTSPLRSTVERHSRAVLVRLPPWALLVLILGLALGGLLAPPALGAVLLGLVALVLLWLTYLRWPVLPSNGRLLRVVVLLLVVGVAVQRATEGA